MTTEALGDRMKSYEAATRYVLPRRTYAVIRVDSRLHGVNSSQRQELLFTEKGINWNDYPDGCKRGRLVTKATGPREVTSTHQRTGEELTIVAERSWWESAPAPHFTPDTLAAIIPTMSTGRPTP